MDSIELGNLLPEIPFGEGGPPGFDPGCSWAFSRENSPHSLRSFDRGGDQSPRKDAIVYVQGDKRPLW